MITTTYNFDKECSIGILENESIYYDIVNTIAVQESSCLLESDQEIIYEAEIFKTAIDKVKALFEKALKKIKEIYDKFMEHIAVLMKPGIAFYKANRKKIEKSKPVVIEGYKINKDALDDPIYEDVYKVYEKEMNSYMQIAQDFLKPRSSSTRANFDFSPRQYIRAGANSDEILNVFRGMIFGVKTGLTQEELTIRIKDYFGISDDLKTKQLTITPKEVIDILDSNVKLHSKALVGYKKVEIAFKKFRLTTKYMQGIIDGATKQLARTNRFPQEQLNAIKRVWGYFVKLSVSAVDVCMICQRSHIKAITEEYKNMKHAATKMIHPKKDGATSKSKSEEREVVSGDVEFTKSDQD